AIFYCFLPPALPSAPLPCPSPPEGQHPSAPCPACAPAPPDGSTIPPDGPSSASIDLAAESLSSNWPAKIAHQNATPIATTNTSDIAISRNMASIFARALSVACSCRGPCRASGPARQRGPSGRRCGLPAEQSPGIGGDRQRRQEHGYSGHPRLYPAHGGQRHHQHVPQHGAQQALARNAPARSDQRGKLVFGRKGPGHEAGMGG